MQPRINPKQNYLTNELAVLLGVSMRTVESWRRCGIHPELKWHRDGRRIVYVGADVLRFLANGKPKRKRRQ